MQDNIGIPRQRSITPSLPPPPPNTQSFLPFVGGPMLYTVSIQSHRPPPSPCSQHAPWRVCSRGCPQAREHWRRVSGCSAAIGHHRAQSQRQIYLTCHLPVRNKNHNKIQLQQVTRLLPRNKAIKSESRSVSATPS